ncbi:hypothetical protein NL676_008203 [Syzygium grande]|nr:hypothetical protein NL676_008203 [Syzygium grande]
MGMYNLLHNFPFAPLLLHLDDWKAWKFTLGQQYSRPSKGSHASVLVPVISHYEIYAGRKREIPSNLMYRPQPLEWASPILLCVGTKPMQE